MFQAPPKISFTFHFWQSLSFLMMWNLQSYPTTVLNERMWHFRGSEDTLTPPTYFQGIRTPNPRDLRPCTERPWSHFGALPWNILQERVRLCQVHEWDHLTERVIALKMSGAAVIRASLSERRWDQLPNCPSERRRRWTSDLNIPNVHTDLNSARNSNF